MTAASSPVSWKRSKAFAARFLAPLAILVFLAALVFGRVGEFGYAPLDDYGYVVLRGQVRNGLSLDGFRWAFTTFSMSNWHPLTWLSHMADVSVFGLAPGPAHIVNVLIHLLNSALVLVLARKVLVDRLASVAVAGLFLVHPLHVESVVWIAERKDVLCAFFFLLACLAHLRYAAVGTRGWYAAIQCAGAAALLSKPMAVTLPLVLLLLDVWPLARNREGAGCGRRLCLRLVIEKLPLMFLSAGVCALTIMAQRDALAPVDQLPVLQRAANVPVALATYFRDLVLPTQLAVFYPVRIPDIVCEVLPASSLMIGVSLVCWRLRVTCPWAAFGWLWFLIMIAPVCGLVQAGSQSHADRYMYLPSLGPLLALGVGLARTRRQQACGVHVAVVAAGLLFYSVLAWIQVGYWRDAFMLYSRVLQVSGEHYTVRMGLSVWYLEHGLLKEARIQASRAVELAPDEAGVHANFGFLELQARNWAAAETSYRRAVELSPRDASLVNNLGLLLEQQGHMDEARVAFSRAIKLDPAMIGFRRNLSRVGGMNP